MVVMNTRWCRCDGGGSYEWLLGHLRSTTEEGGGRRGKGEVKEDGQSQ